MGFSFILKNDLLLVDSVLSLLVDSLFDLLLATVARNSAATRENGPERRKDARDNGVYSEQQRRRGVAARRGRALLLLPEPRSLLRTASLSVQGRGPLSPLRARLVAAGPVLRRPVRSAMDGTQLDHAHRPLLHDLLILGHVVFQS